MEFRNARHTSNLKEIEEFYSQIIGLELLSSFENHNDYDGIFMGKNGHDWHLEFTSYKNKAKHSIDADDLLVFYPSKKEEYDSILEQIAAAQLRMIEPRNPFWKDNGIMIEDPDGYGVIISNMKVK